MATSGPTNLSAYFNTDADFRAWGSGINAALTAISLVQTADTGQINWTTVTKPSAMNTVQGFEIWRFADTLQSTAPVFFRLQYGSGPAADRPSLTLNVGSGSNGSGVLTGQLSSVIQTAPSSSKSVGVTLPTYVCGDSGELLLAVNVDTAANTYGMFLAIERPKDNTDTRQSDGVLVTLLAPLGATQWVQWIPKTGTVPAPTGSEWCSIAPNFLSRASSGADSDASPVFIPLGGVWYYSHLLVLKAGDFAAGGTMTTTILGGSHTYRSLDQSCGTNSLAVNGVQCGFAMLWE